MDKQARILVVDDDSFIRDIFTKTLSESYTISPAENGTDALMLAQSECPDLIILDVEMPGMDGYELCRRLKECDCTAGSPVIFVSAHDQIEERLKGYEAGGEDYIIKPFDPQELKAKVAQLLRTVSERGRLKEMANYATNTAMTAMTSMSEMGALLESLKNFSACSDCRSLADAVLTGLALYGLQGTAQIRFSGEALTRSNQGEATPLEISVINHMAGMNRITAFKSRMSITYSHASLLVNNMPIEDPDRCGRLRDHLAMLAEGAEMKAMGIIAENESRRRGEAIERAAVSITKMLAQVDAAQRQSKISTSVAINEFTGDMEKAYIRVALSEAHEKFMIDVVKSGLEKITNAQSAEIDVQDKLTGIIHELKGIVGGGIS
jgi:DNA-binding response OmpR family regulator